MTDARRTIADFLAPPGPFYRSVSIERDRHDAHAARSYVVTPWLERAAAALLAGFAPGSTRRAWRVTGDFGVGKSALALALFRALDPRTADADGPLAGVADSIAGLPRMFPLVVTGSRVGLGAALAAAVSAGRVELLGLAGAPDASEESLGVDPFGDVSRLRDLAIATGRFDGLLLVVDEMGRFLEAAAANGDEDVFALQRLAEEAVRSGDKPLGVLLILHQGVQAYAERAAGAARSEWAKVAERFDELVFDHPLSHTAALVGAALGPRLANLPAAARRAHSAAVSAAAAVGWMAAPGRAEETSTYPLHPTAIPAIARFFAAQAQNERSLFGFVASEEANGLRFFASQTRPGLELYGLAEFFDYLVTSYGHRLKTGGAGDWERIRSVFVGLEDADNLEAAILKTIAMLNMVDAPDLPATVETVAACLVPEHKGSDVETAIGKLRAGGMLFQRAGRADLRLWTSRRVDLSALWKDAALSIPSVSVLSDLPRHLERLALRDHLLARRHSISTGTTRRFEVMSKRATALGSVETTIKADGAIVIAIPADEDERAFASNWALEATRRDAKLIVAVLPPQDDLGATVLDGERHRWIVANAAVLREDAFAAAEIDRRVTEIQAGLVAHLEGQAGLRGRAPAAPVEIWQGGVEIDAAPPLHILASTVCDALYPNAPRIDNEMVNRHALTSAGAAARQRLIEAMFANEGVAQLGFDGSKNPPERALYLSILKRGRLHVEEGEGFAVRIPDGDDPLRLGPALREIRRMLESIDGRIGIQAIYERLAARPFGVRAALSPVLLAIVLVADRHRVALFERGTYCVRVDGQAFMRILKSPGHFALQWVSIDGVRVEVFRRLASIVGTADQDGLLSVVTPLMRFAAELPFFVQRTSGLSPTAASVRDALLRTRGPSDLIFSDLPKACDCAPFGIGDSADAASVDAFVARLEDAITEIRACYPRLLDHMRVEVASALQAAEPLRESLVERAAAIRFTIREQSMRTFATRLGDSALSDDAWIEALGGALIEKPPIRWTGPDEDMWRSRLEHASATFRRLEAAAFEGGAGHRGAMRVCHTHVDGREWTSVVDVTDADEATTTIVRTIARSVKDGGISLERVIAMLSLDLLDQERSSDENTDKEKVG